MRLDTLTPVLGAQHLETSVLHSALETLVLLREVSCGAVRTANRMARLTLQRASLTSEDTVRAAAIKTAIAEAPRKVRQQ